METHLRHQALKPHPVEASPLSDQRNGTKCVETITKKVSSMFVESRQLNKN
jgi:hypothetical protein